MANIIAIFVVLIPFVNTQIRQIRRFSATPEDMHCFSFDGACSDCIREPGCQWCSTMKLNSSEHKCFSTNTDLRDHCHPNDIEHPKNSEIIYIQDDEFTVGNKSTGNIVQLKPQKIKLSLRKGVSKRIKLSYRQVADYPLDLYYLMDVSNSMKEDKKTLAALGSELAKAMRSLTSQFKIGFGSFVDKVMLPFVNIHPSVLNNPGRGVVMPFSFRNNLKLTENDREFTSQVNAAGISTNIDSPEGGFDALMQAMVCDEEIGWRNHVRKIIIFSTDAEFHYAGDGKLAGVVRPNDGKCHLNRDGFYDKFDEFDYPSIGQINQKAKEKGINIIFAVKDHFNLYKQLASVIEGAAFGELTAKSTNVIKLVADVYNNITSRVLIADRSGDENNPISMRFYSQCNDPTAALRETNECGGVKEGQTFDFEVDLQVDECPPGVRKSFLKLGTLQDTVEIEVDLLCDCDCELETAPGYEEDSPRCSRSGSRQCGVCACNTGFYGNQCQCNQTQTTGHTTVSDPSKCRPDGASDTDQVCSGRGRCECETCICRNPEIIGGLFCQCNKAQCMQSLDDPEECSGNGRCNCDHCSCDPGFEGQVCECRTQAACLPPGEHSEFCSGNGDCNCGKCTCHVKDGVPYSGKYCEECPSCGKGKCLVFRDCVQCDVWNSGLLEGEPCKNCSLKRVQQLHSLENLLSQGATLCTFVDESTGCDFNFTYFYRETTYEVYAQNKQKCPEKIAVLAATLAVIGGIVAIGILTLVLWKILTTLHDRREFARFEQESKNAAWGADENPLYKNPTTTVANPAFTNK